MKIKHLAMYALAGLALCACTLSSGRPATDHVDVSGVRRVEFSGAGDLSISQGETEGLTIKADQAVLDRIIVDVRGDTLEIGLREGLWRHVAVPSVDIRYELTVRDLNSVTLSGAGDVHVGDLETEKLYLELSGAGQIDASDLTVAQVSVRISGAGSATLSGTTDSQEALLSGAGAYKADDLSSAVAKVEITGAGDATVWATESLQARIMGLGSIRYYGQPRLEQQVTGLGQIKQLGDR